MTPSTPFPWRFAVGFGILLVIAVLNDGRAAAWAATISPAWRAFARFLTAFGSSGYMFALGSLVALAAGCGLLRGGRADAASRRRFSGLLERALFFLAAVALSGIAAQLLKHAVGRARPTVAGSDAFVFHPFSLGNGFASFPSGHAASAFAAATALSLMLSRGRIALFVFAGLIAISRVLLGAHLPSDVLCGTALGAVTPLILAQTRRWHFIVAPRRSPGSGLPASAGPEEDDRLARSGRPTPTT